MHGASIEAADLIAEALGDCGYCVVDGALSDALARDLARECAGSEPATFKPAGTGRREDYQHDARVRSDAIRWLSSSNAADAGYIAVMEELRAALNSRLYLGLFDYECHYARYASGAFYRRHVDAFVGAKNRVVSTVFYLNDDWRAEQGGELLLYEPEATEPFESVLPHYNRLVVFLSERFPHEVKPATRERHSIAGWFRVRA